MTLQVSPKHVFVHQHVFVQSLVQLEAIQAQETHPKEWSTQYHIQHGMVHPKLQSGTSSLEQIHTMQGVHPTVLMHQNSSNATLAR
jgi:hypothetical protein